jgi:lycopene cyclase domain-containing protein
VFIYECVHYYFKLRDKQDWGWKVLLWAGIVVLVTGLMNSYKAYTFTSFSFCGFALVLLYLFRNRFPSFHAAVFIIAYFISLVPFFIVNGILTALPVVAYNDMENLGIRLYTIPVEDSVYGMLLLLCNIAGMEWMRGRRAKTS